ncbi:MAG: ATP-dependent acyl-CoA ligase [Frankiales bacterium]|nr:ATP-dependent acyl-CoA ligase [Frankiales bacterium]
MSGTLVGSIDVDQTLTDLLVAAAEKWPDRVFLRMDGVDTTFAEFRDQTARLAGRLAAEGVGPGTRMNVLMRNSRACVQSWFAANWLGASWVPVNTEWRGSTLANAVTLTDPTLIIVDEDLRGHLHEAFPGGAATATLSAPLTGGVASLDEWTTGDPVPPAPQASTETAGMLYTSGTTGRSKACVLSHRYFVTQGAIAVRDFGLRPDDVLYCPFPLFHADATALTTVPALLIGATAALSRRFSASRFWGEVRASGATVFDFMGATLSILYKAPPAPDDADNTVRLAWGVPVPDWAPDFERRFGLDVRELYGSVEANIPITQPLGRPKVLGSCGRVTPEFELRVATEAGDPVAPGDVGELLIRPRLAGTVLDGYFGDPEATARAFSGLWFHSGDLVRTDDDDNFFFVGRGKDSIRRRGENISALEVEEGIEAHPDVLECAAVGVPSELTEEDVKVFVIARPGSGLDADTLWQHCDATMAKFQVPRYITFVTDLPKTPTGKISKQEVVESLSGLVTHDREAGSIT